MGIPIGLIPSRQFANVQTSKTLGKFYFFWHEVNLFRFWHLMNETYLLAPD